MYAAWERFVHGEDDLRGVRPEVAISWHRCREEYGVDPGLTQAPVAVTEVDHSPEDDVAFTELGFRAAAVAHEVINTEGIVTVADATGRILAEWGDKGTRDAAASANMAPWYCWSEYATGTNGMGTALAAHGPVLVRGAEHWCQAFHDWTCAGVAVRHAVTKDPVAVLNVSRYRGELPAAVGTWLANAANETQATLRRRARDDGAELVAAFNHAHADSGTPLAALDTSGKVVIADEMASVLLGVPASTPALDPTVRWSSGLPELIGASRYASQQAARDHDWVGSTQIFPHLAAQPTPISIRPVFLSGHVIGNLVRIGVSDGESLSQADGVTRHRVQQRRVVATREDRTVLLALQEVHFAESEGNDVWLVTDQGRLRAAQQGLEKLDSELEDAGFLRVHRRYVVNLNRVREVERRSKGELYLIMDDQPDTMVPVSRRNAPAVRRALGI